jgi:hypothetical protein
MHRFARVKLTSPGYNLSRLPRPNIEEEAAAPAADFSRIRNARLGRSTIDRLMLILTKLGQKVEVTVTRRELMPQ